MPIGIDKLKEQQARQWVKQYEIVAQSCLAMIDSIRNFEKQLVIKKKELERIKRTIRSLGYEPLDFLKQNGLSDELIKTQRRSYKGGVRGRKKEVEKNEEANSSGAS